MTMTTIHLVVGVGYEDHINDRAFFNLADAEARKKHLETWRKLIPQCTLFDDRAIELFEKAIAHFCRTYDYPEHMNEFVTHFKIETLELRGDQHAD